MQECFTWVRRVQYVIQFSVVVRLGYASYCTLHITTQTPREHFQYPGVGSPEDCPCSDVFDRDSFYMTLPPCHQNSEALPMNTADP